MKKILFLFIFIFSSQALAVEEILNYDAIIRVQPDASVVVTESISVNREGKQIRRGIYRDLPLTKGITYKVMSVRRNGAPENFFSVKSGNNYRINTGTDDYLPHDGVYTYEITYKAFNAVKPFKNYDEIYWNVTGNNWIFPIKRATARVILLANTEQIQEAGYIGKRGSTEKAVYDKDFGAFESPRPLGAGEGLTVAVGFSKGFIQFSKTAYLQNISFNSILLLAAMIMITYMYITWSMYGKDAEMGAVMPRFDVPKDITAAQAGYIYTYGENSNKCMIMAFIQMAIQKFMLIQEKTSFRISLLRQPENREEKTFDKNLFFPIVITNKYNQELGNFKAPFEKYLKSSVGIKYFVANRRYTVFALLLLFAVLTGLSFVAGFIFYTVLLLFYSPFFYASGKMVIGCIKQKKFSFGAFSMAAFVLIHFSLMTVGMSNSPEVHASLIPVAVFYIVFMCILPIYSYLMYQPTEEGQKVIAHIEGIKMFLKATQQNFPKDISFEKMEKLLPFAILLDLEKEWDEKVKDMMKSLKEPPQWYTGHRLAASRFNSFGKTLASAGTPPRSSGSGGRGSSGGGGGGGGGGGR